MTLQDELALGQQFLPFQYQGKDEKDDINLWQQRSWVIFQKHAICTECGNWPKYASDLLHRELDCENEQNYPFAQAFHTLKPEQFEQILASRAELLAKHFLLHFPDGNKPDFRIIPRSQIKVRFAAQDDYIPPVEDF